MRRFYEYIEKIKKKEILHCAAVLKSVLKTEKELQKKKNEFVFVEEEAQNVIDFIEVLKHHEGKFAGQPIRLELWQVYLIANLYGWKEKKTGKRRYNKAFVFVGRKNGKTLLASTLMLHNLLVENSAQVYSIATQKKQAEISFTNCKNFVAHNSDLGKLVSSYRSSLVFFPKGGKLEALSSEHNKFDGFSPSFVLADEIAAHPNGRLIDVMASGMASRVNPLLLEITTAGYNLESPGYHDYQRAKKILDGVFEDDHFFPLVYELDNNDDWTDKKKWIKANPSLGVTLTEEFLETQLTEAKQKPQAEAEFRIKHCNQWQSGQDQAWIPDRVWTTKTKNPNNMRIPENSIVWGGIDLSKRNDWTAYTLYAKADDMLIAKHRFYVPENTIQTRFILENPLIMKWVQDGLLTAIPGDVIDYDYLLRDIGDDAKTYRIRCMGYDPWLAQDLVNKLSDTGLTMLQFPMGGKYFSPPAKAWEAMILNGKIIDNNPIMRWMVLNCSITTDVNGNIHPVKIDYRKSTRRIDGVISSIMAYFCATVDDVVDQNMDDFTY